VSAPDWGDIWRAMVTLGVIFLLWAGVVALAIVTALHAAYQGTTPTRENTNDGTDNDAAP
jgi:hypothetical protein